MDAANESSEGVPFILLGLTTSPGQRRPLFVLFLFLYVAGILGNGLIVAAIQASPVLQAPMYFLLAHLSFADLCFTSSVTVPKMLANLLSYDHSISLAGCLTQMYFFFALGVTESCLLAAMAYDRYVAIWHPLHYATRMSQAVCMALVGTAWLVSHIHSLLHILLMARLSFCASHQVPHFFCDLLIFTEGAAVVVTPFLLILASFGAIAAAVLRLPSASGRLQAVSTCGSHLAVVGLFYGTVITVYFQPTSQYKAEQGCVATVMYTIVTPC
ncbi:Olfactory receptor 1K1 [Sciurus carolinensis]|uniref:Olfactory receptor n=1 Tax=Sciurus carolinensis TaxID=30640 RepID=A0AA41NFM0_SCICA|nr:Olfactory receptor 1K1 [Sciurus carolinensis]